MRRVLITIALVLGVGIATARDAAAGLITFTTPHCSGFEDCSNAAFMSALGSPDLFLSFSVDKFGADAPIGLFDGAMFSDLVAFSSAPSAFNPGGSASIMSLGAGTGSEIGPTPEFGGVLRIDFLNPVWALGFGTVELLQTDIIRIYGTDGALLGAFSDPSDAVFDFFGVIDTSGPSISRVEIEGSYFAIQDFTADVVANPEPSTIALFGTGLGLLGFARQRRRRQK